MKTATGVRIKNALSLLLNVLLAALAAYSVAQFFTSRGDGNMQVAGVTCFRYFTVLSNVLAGATCLAVVPYNIKSLVCGRDTLSRWAMLLKYIGTVAVAVTLIVVLVFLGPSMGYAMMFVGGSLYLHLINPLLAMISFCLLENGGTVDGRDALFGDLSVILYGTVYLVLVVIVGEANGGWPDFYGFNRGNMWYVSYPSMLLGGYAVATALRAGHNAVIR